MGGGQTPVLSAPPCTAETRQYRNNPKSLPVQPPTYICLSQSLDASAPSSCVHPPVPGHTSVLHILCTWLYRNIRTGVTEFVVRALLYLIAVHWSAVLRNDWDVEKKKGTGGTVQTSCSSLTRLPSKQKVDSLSSNNKGNYSTSGYMQKRQ